MQINGYLLDPMLNGFDHQEDVTINFNHHLDFRLLFFLGWIQIRKSAGQISKKNRISAHNY